MNKKIEINLGAGIFILFGIFYLFKEILPSLILITIGLGISPDVRNLCLVGLKFLWNKISNKKETQKLVNSPHEIEQQANNSGMNVVGNNNKMWLYPPKEDKKISPKKHKLAKLYIYFDKKKTHHPRIINDKIRGFFFHVMVKNNSKTIAKNCIGELIEVKEFKNGDYSEVNDFAPIILKWGNKDYGEKRDIDKDIPRPLDICFTNENNNNYLIDTDGISRGIQTQFPKGKYKISVRVKGDNTDFSYGEFYIDFDGDWKNLKISNLESLILRSRYSILKRLKR
ncbi:MAG: hypothetical protein KAT28_02535 [Candidatus Aenigmarchaeota archaeon]|nr:hypothetical protein [Candidatus Aenigmarchaeota archaeon]